MSTKITEKMTINGVNKNVVLDGIDFTGNGYVDVYGADSITIKNCRVYGMNVSADKNYWLRIYNDIPVKLVLENCFFGGAHNGQGKMYNFIEPNAKLKNGSKICDNYFTDDCCTHNTVNIYGCDEDAIIQISGNVFETSAGTVRVGVKGEPACIIEMRNNVVLSNNADYSESDWGLLTIQPYGKQTTSFSNMKIVMSDNVVPCEQVGYYWLSANDMVITEDNKPTIIVDGKVVDFEIYS